MPLLHKKKVIKKLQAGGTVPLYTSYSYKDASQPAWNPAQLLSRYSKPAAAKTTASKSREKKKYEVVGLNNEAKVLSDEIFGYEKALENGLATAGEGFYTTEAYADIKRGMATIDTKLLNNKNNQDAFDAAKKSALSDANQAGNEWLMTKGYGLAERYNENKELVTKWIDPEDLKKDFEEGQGTKWRSISVSDAILKRNDAVDDFYLGKNGNIVTGAIANMLGEKNVLNNIDLHFKGIGNQSESGKLIIKGQEVGDQVVRDWEEGRATGDNRDALNAAFNNLIADVRGGSEWNTLIGREYLKGNVTTNEQAMAGVEKYLRGEMAKRLKTKKADTDKIKNDGPGGENDSRDVLTGAAEVNRVLMDNLHSGADPKTLKLERRPTPEEKEKEKEKEKGKKAATNTIMKFIAVEQPYIKEINNNSQSDEGLSIKQEAARPIKDGGDNFNLIASVAERSTMAGFKLSDIIIPEFANDLKNKTDLAVDEVSINSRSKSGVELTWLPTNKDKTIWNPTAEEIKTLNKNIADATAAAKKDNEKIFNSSTTLQEALAKKIKGLKDKFATNNGTVEIKPYYLTYAVIRTSDILKNIKELEEEEKKSDEQIKALAGLRSVYETSSPATESDINWTWGVDKTTKEPLARTMEEVIEGSIGEGFNFGPFTFEGADKFSLYPTITPRRSNAYLAKYGKGKVYQAKYKSSLSFLNDNPGTGKAMTKEEQAKAIENVEQTYYQDQWLKNLLEKAEADERAAAKK